MTSGSPHSFFSYTDFTVEQKRNSSARILQYLLLCAALASAADNDAPRRLAARALGDTPIFSDLRDLCDGIGGRPTGSPAAQRAIDWGTRKFREAGLTVAVEPFKIPNLWLPRLAEASAISST